MKTTRLIYLIIFVLTIHGLTAQNNSIPEFYMYKYANIDSIYVKPINPNLINRKLDTVFIDTTKNSWFYKDLIPKGAKSTLREEKKYSKDTANNDCSFWFSMKTNKDVSNALKKKLPKELFCLDSIHGYPFLIDPGNGNSAYIYFYKDLMFYNRKFYFEIYKIKRFNEVSSGQFIATLYHPNCYGLKEISINYLPNSGIYKIKFKDESAGYPPYEFAKNFINIKDIHKYNLISVYYVTQMPVLSFSKWVNNEVIEMEENK